MPDAKGSKGSCVSTYRIYAGRRLSEKTEVSWIPHPLEWGGQKQKLTESTPDSRVMSSLDVRQVRDYSSSV